MRSLGINYTFISYEDDDFIKNLKYELMDYGPIVKKDISKTNKKFKLNKNLYFRTCRVLYNGSNFYSSEYNYYNNMPRKPLEQIHDDPKFWESIEDFYIFSLD